MNFWRTTRRIPFRRILHPLANARLLLFPIAAEIRGYDREKLNADARSGLVTALLALPQGLAYALIAGLPAQHGVYAAIAGMALGAMFSGSRHVSFGPSVTVSVLLLSTFVRLDITDEQRPEAVAILLLLVAVILTLAAWFRFAQLTRYISRSVTVGFIVAAGLLVVVSQLKHVCGLDLPESGVFAQDLRATILALGQTNWASLLVAALTAGVYLALSLKARRWPAAAAAVLTGALTAWLLALGGQPVPHLTNLDYAWMPRETSGLRFTWSGVIANSAFALALFAHLETTIIGRSLAARAGDRYDSNQHVFALGVANLGNALCSGLPASGSLTRSRLIWRLRARTPMAGVLAALFCAALFTALAPVLAWVPRAALAALAMLLATEIVSRHYLRVIVRSSPADAFVLVATIAAGLLFRLDVALYIGAGLSILFFLRRVGVPELTEYGFTDEGQLAAYDHTSGRLMPDISIVHVEGDLFFGAAEIFADQARRVVEDPNLKVIILRMKNAHHLDATCALAIEELLRFAREHDRYIIVSGAHREIYRVFRTSGLLNLLGRENFFMHVPSNPTRSTRNALKRAQQLLGGQEANIRIYVDPAKNPAATTAAPNTAASTSAADAAAKPRTERSDA